jgi:lantibiotic modifying enzyme
MGKLLILGRAHSYSPHKHLQSTIASAINVGLNAILNAVIIIPNTQQAYWSSPKLHDDVVSIGLAHGQASYIWALSAICQEEQGYINPDIKIKVKHTVYQACNFLTNRIIPNKEQIPFNIQNFFSIHQVATPSASHTLSWCNGALGASLALLKASTLLNNPNIEQKALKVLTHLSQIKTDNANIWQEGKYIDCGMCHGTLGVFFIFYILHRKFGKVEFKEAYEYWLEQSISNTDWSELFLGMKVCNVEYIDGERKMNWIYMASLLNGAAGYGIILLSYHLLEHKLCTEDDLSWITIFI